MSRSQEHCGQAAVLSLDGSLDNPDVRESSNPFQETRILDIRDDQRSGSQGFDLVRWSPMYGVRCTKLVLGLSKTDWFLFRLGF